MAFNAAGSVFDTLGLFVFGEIAAAWGIKEDLKKLRRTMSIIKAELLDAEKKQARNQELSTWLTQLKDILLDAQDVLEQFESHEQRTKALSEYGSAIENLQCYLFPTSNPPEFRIRISHRIRIIRKRLDEIENDKDNFQLSEQDDQENRTRIRSGQRGRAAPTHSSLRAGLVLGRDEDKNNIKKYLVPSQSVQKDDPSSSRSHISEDQLLSVIAIQGVVGIGKTALAKLVYHDKEVRENFQQRIWISLSAYHVEEEEKEKEEDFDVPTIIRDIIQRVTIADDLNGI